MIVISVSPRKTLTNPSLSIRELFIVLSYLERCKEIVDELSFVRRCFPTESVLTSFPPLSSLFSSLQRQKLDTTTRTFNLRLSILLRWMDGPKWVLILSLPIESISSRSLRASADLDIASIRILLPEVIVTHTYFRKLRSVIWLLSSLTISFLLGFESTKSLQVGS